MINLYVRLKLPRNCPFYKKNGQWYSWISYSYFFFNLINNSLSIQLLHSNLTNKSANVHLPRIPEPHLQVPILPINLKFQAKSPPTSRPPQFTPLQPERVVISRTWHCTLTVTSRSIRVTQVPRVLFTNIDCRCPMLMMLFLLARELFWMLFVVDRILLV